MAEDSTVEMAATPETASEPCAECGSPLAADQRYCLNCGKRRGEPRVDYAPHLAGERVTTTETTTTAPAVAPAAVGPREPSPLIAVGGIALLGLMLLVGVLIGRGDGGSTEPAAAPTVVQLDEGGTVDETASTGGGEVKEDVKADVNVKESGGGGGAGGGGAAPGGDNVAITGEVGSGSGTTEDPEVADRSELEALESATGAEQQEASANLPDTIALPGEAPPVDDVAPGGGAEGTVIK